MQSEARYRIISEIGRGAMGIVYLAHDSLMEREVALKVLSLPSYLKEKDIQELISRFLREAQAAGRLSSHPNIITTHDVGEQDGMHFIAMELIRGEPLRNLIEGGPLNFEEAIDIMLQLSDAIDYAHSKGIIHRDLKPENIFVLADGRIKIGDFGIARVLSKATVTEVGTVIGTPGYMSPEQVKGKEARPTSDIFAAGVIFYELISGLNPFELSLEEPSHASIAYSVVNEDPIPLKELNPDVPEEFDAIIFKAIEKDPAQRYPSFRHLLNDLTILSMMFPEYEYHVKRELISGQLLAYATHQTGHHQRRLILRRRPNEEAPEEPGALHSSTSELKVDKPEEVVVQANQVISSGIREEEIPPSKGATPVSFPADAGAKEHSKNLIPARRVWVFATLVLFILIVAGLSVSGILSLKNRRTSALQIPNLIGLTEAQAKKKVEKEGFKFKRDYKKTDNIREPGKVIDQNPTAGSKVKKGTEVSVIVAVRGKQDVPNLVGMTREEALRILAEIQLNSNPTEQPVADKSQHGIIISQDPAVGVKLDAGAPVALVIGVYREPQKQQKKQPREQKKPLPTTIACSTCSGRGWITQNYQEQVSVKCLACGGDGKDPLDNPCFSCAGDGMIESTVTKQHRVNCPTCGGTGKI